MLYVKATINDTATILLSENIKFMNAIITVIVLMLSAAYLIWLLLQDRVAKPKPDKDFLMALFKMGWYERPLKGRKQK